MTLDIATKAPIPANEVERLRALQNLEVLDTLPEEAIDRITRLAARIIDVPIALVSLVDRDRQWFKSKVGLDAPETARDLAFCAHAIMGDDVMVVPDAAADSRFADNPLVTGSPHIRFYAGAPLIISDGIRLGTLCAIDIKPRPLSVEDQIALRDLAAIVVDEFQLRMQLKNEVTMTRELREQQVKLEHANEALDQFAHLASHDLRAPLKKIINLIDMALFDSDDEDNPLLGLARNSAESLETMVSGYRALARLQRTERATVRVSELVERANEFTGDGATPEVTNDDTVLCDPTLMVQVFVNLIENARTHGSDGHVSFASTTENQVTRIRAENKVAEVFPVDQSVFAPFRRLNTDSDGSGLGLAIVERVARIHGGSARATCEDGQFCIEVEIPHSDPTP